MAFYLGSLPDIIRDPFPISYLSFVTPLRTPFDGPDPPLFCRASRDFGDSTPGALGFRDSRLQA